MTPQDAITSLRGLPPDRQRAILARLSPEVKRGVLTQLKQPQQQVASPKPQPATSPTTRTPFEDVGLGALKGLMSSFSDITSGAPRYLPVDPLRGVKEKAYKQTEEFEKPTNTAQQVGKVAEAVGELVYPANKIPRAGRAGKAIGEIEKLAAQRGIHTMLPNTTPEVSKAMGIAKYSSNEPKVLSALNQDIQGIKNAMPHTLGMSFEEARNAYSEMTKAARRPGLLQKWLFPQTVTSGKLRGQLKVATKAMNEDLAQSLSKAGLSQKYTDALNEYRRAMEIRATIGKLLRYGALGAVPWYYRHAIYQVLPRGE